MSDIDHRLKTHEEHIRSLQGRQDATDSVMQNNTRVIARLEETLKSISSTFDKFDHMWITATKGAKIAFWTALSTFVLSQGGMAALVKLFTGVQL